MKREEKDLVLRDLCARLPYGVIGVYSWKGNEPYNRELTGSLFDELKSSWDSTEDSKFLPYLRPMSSMTEKEQKEFVKFHCVNICPIVITEELTISNESEMFDWLNKKMFDYFVKTYDDDFDSTYGYYVFSVPDEWQEDFDKILNGEKPSPKYVEQMCKVFPKLEEQFKRDFGL